MRWSQIVFSCAVLAALPARAAAPADCSAFATVERFHGTLHFDYSKEGENEYGRAVARHHGSVRFELTTPFRFPGQTQFGFEGPGVGSVSLDDTVTEFGFKNHVITFQGVGTPVHDSGQGGINLLLDLDTCRYSFFWSVNVNGTITDDGVTGAGAALGLGKVQSGERDIPSGPPAPLTGGTGFPVHSLLWYLQHLDAEAYIPVNNAGATLPGGFVGEDAGGALLIDWSFVPGPPEELELVVTIPAYDDWLPEAGSDESSRAANDDLELKATVRKKGGGVPTFPPRSIDFELLSRSSERGIALNFPQRSERANPPKPDLRFDPAVNLPRKLQVVDADGALARTIAPPVDGKASALLSTYDWGGYGVLQVTAITADGERLVGMLDGDSTKTEIPIPKRTLPSRIADHWKDLEGVLPGVSDKDDSEELPLGDTSVGDGLSVYEEYRGFMLNGQHSRKKANDRLDPLQKDVFVRNCIGANALGGIATFKGATGLLVHSELRDDELPTGEACPKDVDVAANDRVINFNSGDAAAHAIDEHVIVLIQNTDADANRARGGPGLPRKVSRVVIADSTGITATKTGKVVTVQIDARKQERYKRTVAHELGHSVNIYHHGSGDLDPVRWYEANGVIVEQGVTHPAVGDPVLVGPARQIIVRTEAGAVLSASDLDLPNEYYVGVQQGEHSGDADCLMRYESAEAFVPAASTTPATRYYVGSEIAGDRMCVDEKGTGVNDATARPTPPGPRYGDADKDAQRGGCVKQIRVNDALPDLPR